MRSWKQAVLAIVLTLVTLITGSSIHAQDAIPLTPVPDVQAVSECTTEPANLDRVREIAGDAVNDPAAVLGFEEPITGGEVVTGPDADAAIALMDQLIACLNAEDAERFIGLFSDGLIERAAYDLAFLLEEAEELESSEPADGGGDIEDDVEPIDPVFIVGTSAVYAQPDGRLTYSVSIGSMDIVNSDNIPVPLSLIQIIAIEQRGEWKIDDLREQDLSEPAGDPDCGTDGEDGCLASPQAGGTYVEGEGYAGWLMGEAAAAEAAPWLMSIDEDTAIPFVPNEAEVAEAEAALPAFIAGHPNATDRMNDELTTGFYERQYIGYGTPDGAILVINAYCGEPFGDPAAEVEIVMDGGDCFWQAIYNLTEGEFTNLSVNGEA